MRAATARRDSFLHFLRFLAAAPVVALSTTFLTLKASFMRAVFATVRLIVNLFSCLRKSPRYFRRREYLN